MIRCLTASITCTCSTIISALRWRVLISTGRWSTVSRPNCLLTRRSRSIANIWWVFSIRCFHPSVPRGRVMSRSRLTRPATRMRMAISVWSRRRWRSLRKASVWPWLGWMVPVRPRYCSCWMARWPRRPVRYASTRMALHTIRRWSVIWNVSNR